VRGVEIARRAAPAAPLAEWAALSWRRAVAAGGGLLALVLGSLALGVAAALQPVPVLAGIAAALVVAWTLARPVRGAYLYALLVPLIVGMSRGLVVPVLRPNELLILALLGLVILRGTLGPADGRVRLGPFTAVDRAFGLLFVFGALVPLAVMLYRSGVPSAEDTFQLLSLLKYYLSYRLLLAVVPDEKAALRVAGVMLAASAVVASIGLLQLERLFGLHEWLATYYSAGQVREALEFRRATSTLGVWQALGAYLGVHAALAAALLLAPATPRRWRPWLVLILGLDIVGALATVSLTAVLALGLGLGLVAVMARRVGRLVVLASPVILLTFLLLAPALEERLTYQFASYGASGTLPVTWEYRWSNLVTVFWPAVQDHLLFGVAPSVSPELAWRFPENQAMYLLYQGGLLYVGAYFLFMGVVLRTTWRFLRRLDGPALAVGRAALIAWLLILVLGLFDPHLTMAGEADAAWALLALATGAAAHAGRE